MKKFALLKLQYGANQVIDDCMARNVTDAAFTFNLRGTVSNRCTVNRDGYGKQGEITYCVAEYFNQ